MLQAKSKIKILLRQKKKKNNAQVLNIIEVVKVFRGYPKSAYMINASYVNQALKYCIYL